MQRWWGWVTVLLVGPMVVPYIGQSARDEWITLSYVLRSSWLDPYGGERLGNEARERHFIKPSKLTVLLDDIQEARAGQFRAGESRTDASEQLSQLALRARNCGDEITARAILAQTALSLVWAHRPEEYTAKDLLDAKKWKLDLRIRPPNALEKKYIEFALKQCERLEQLDPQNGAWLRVVPPPGSAREGATCQSTDVRMRTTAISRSLWRTSAVFSP